MTVIIPPSGGGGTNGAPAGLTGATDATRYAGGTTSGPPLSGTFAVGDFVIDQTGRLWVCTIAGTPGAWAQPVAGTTTKRVTLPFSGDGMGGTRADTTDLCERVLVTLPVTTSRWRLRFRNASSGGTIYANALSVTGLWRGNPSIPSSGGWVGDFTATPDTCLSSFTTDAAGAEYTSAWITDPALQFTAGKLYGMSYGLTCAAGTTFPYSTSGAVYSRNASNAASAGAASMPGTKEFYAAYFDARIEYEFVTPTTGGVAVGLFVGDSLTSGITANEGQSAFPHETWAGHAGVKFGFAWQNIGVGGTRISNWAGATTGYQWTRCDLTTTVPDFACILLGTNDALSGTALASQKTDYRTVISNVVSLGIPRGRIFVGTVPSCNVAGANETNRLALNTELSYPIAGTVGGLLDFDKVIGTDPDLVPGAGAHLYHRGYQRMASLLGTFARQ